MTEIPLIEEKELDALGPASTYVAPKVALPAPKNIPTLESLPQNAAQREQALAQWTEQLKAWQENLENLGTNSASSSASERKEISGSSGLRTTWKIVYAGWFVALCVLAMNAISITVLRVATASSVVPLAEIAWAYVLWLVFGSIASFSVMRLIYTAMRKLRTVLIREAVLMELLQFAVVLVCLAGIPGSGTAGIWVCIEAARASTTLGIAPAALCGVASFLWLVLAVLSCVILLRLRRLSSEMNKSSLGDAYRKFEEEERSSVSVFTVDDEPMEKKEKKEKSEMAAEVEAKLPHHHHHHHPPLPSQHAPSHPGEEDEVVDDIFTSNASSKKSKKSKKHRKKTTGKSTTPPPPDAE